MALRNDGTVVAWGSNNSGEVTGTPGAGETSIAIANPVTLGGQALSGVTAIAAGESQTVALKAEGSVVAWSGNSSGRTIVPGVARRGVAAIAAGYAHIVALVVPTAPTILTPTASQAVDLWQSATFAVTATGYPVTYQWRKNGRDVPGATGPAYRIDHVVANQMGES